MSVASPAPLALAGACAPAASSAPPPAPPSARGEPVWEVAWLYPLQGEWTEADYLALDAAGGRLVELSDGAVEFPTMPDVIHQFLSEHLFDALRDSLRTQRLPGRVVTAPFPVRLWDGKFREPDLTYLRPGRIRDRRRPPDGADLVIEIVSPGADARKRDMVTKPTEYAAAGIPEYWIVDPETRTVTVLTLDGVEPGGAYRVHGEFVAGQTAPSLLLPGFAVDVDELFAAGDGDAGDEHAEGNP